MPRTGGTGTSGCTAVLQRRKGANKLEIKMPRTLASTFMNAGTVLWTSVCPPVNDRNAIQDSPFRGTSVCTLASRNARQGATQSRNSQNHFPNAVASTHRRATITNSSRVAQTQNENDTRGCKCVQEKRSGVCKIFANHVLARLLARPTSEQTDAVDSMTQPP